MLMVDVCDLDQMFMIDMEGNMLPAHEIRGTWEPLPQQYLAGKDLDTLQDIPDEVRESFALSFEYLL